MHKPALFSLFSFLALALIAVGTGCNRPNAGNATEAIQQARSLKTPQAQADYLLGQARLFLEAKDYQEATKTAQYVLSSVDSQSKEAEKILAAAKMQVANDAQQAIGDTKHKLGL